MLLTPEQMYEIQKIINEHHLAFTVNSMGEDSVPPEVLKELKKKGLVKDPLNSMSEAYLYGHLLGTKENKATAGMSYRDFKQYMENNDIPLTALERGAMAMAAKSAGQYCRGLGNRIDVATGAMLIEADRMLRARMESDIRTATAENIARRETVKQLKTDLGWATRDWARDLERIAITEKVTAMNQGTADSFKKEHGADVLVAKRALPGACRHCLRLHNGPSGNPRVFKLSDLEANGTNVGKKANDWQATVGALHPGCQCLLLRLPTGWGFDESGEMVPGGQVDMYESPEELKRSMRQEEELQFKRWVAGTRTNHGEVIKSGGPFIGPRGGKWADPDHKIPWKETGPERTKKVETGEADQARQNPEGQTSMFGAPKTPTEIFTEVAAKFLPKPKKESQGSLLLSDARFVLFGHGEDFDALKKSWGGLSKSILANIAAESGQAGNRAPGPGLGVNFVIFPPKKKKGTGYTPRVKEIMSRDDDGDDDSTGAMHSKKEDYDFHDRYSQVRPYVYPEQYREAHKDARRGSKDRMEAAKKAYADNIMLPRNKAEVAS